MKRGLIVLIVLAALLIIVTATASAGGPTPNDHNCAGVIVNMVVGPGEPPMGHDITSEMAHLFQGVNDLFLMWAGQTGDPVSCSLG